MKTRRAPGDFDHPLQEQVLSCCCVHGRIAGSLYAHHARYLNPNDFTFNKSIEILIMVVVGGLGSLPGAVIGAIVIVLMPEFLRSSGEWRLILFGALVVVLMGVSRGGIAGLVPMLLRLLPRFRSGPIRKPSESVEIRR